MCMHVVLFVVYTGVLHCWAYVYYIVAVYITMRIAHYISVFYVQCASYININIICVYFLSYYHIILYSILYYIILYCFKYYILYCTILLQLYKVIFHHSICVYMYIYM